MSSTDNKRPREEAQPNQATTLFFGSKVSTEVGDWLNNEDYAALGQTSQELQRLNKPHLLLRELSSQISKFRTDIFNLHRAKSQNEILTKTKVFIDELGTNTTMIEALGKEFIYKSAAQEISELQVKYTDKNMHIIAREILRACPQVNYYSLTAVDDRARHLTCDSAGPNKKHDLQFCGVRHLKDPRAVADNDGYTTP